MIIINYRLGTQLIVTGVSIIIISMVGVGPPSIIVIIAIGLQICPEHIGIAAGTSPVLACIQLCTFSAQNMAGGADDGGGVLEVVELLDAAGAQVVHLITIQ